MSSASKRKQASSNLFVNDDKENQLLDDQVQPRKRASKAYDNTSKNNNSLVHLSNESKSGKHVVDAVPQSFDPYDDDEGSDINTLLVQIQKSNKLKASKKNEQLQSVVDNSFKSLDDLIRQTVHEEEVYFKRSQEETSKEFRQLHDNLQGWTNQIIEATNTYFRTMKNYVSEIGECMKHFEKAFSNINHKALNSQEQRARMTYLINQCKDTMDQLKEEIGKKNPKNGVDKNMAILLQALMNQN